MKDVRGEYKITELGEIPKEWSISSIEAVADSVDYRGKTPQKVDKGIILVTAKNIQSGYIDYEVSKEYIQDEAYDFVMSRGKPQIGDVLFTTEAPLGNVANVDRENIALAQRVIKFRGKQDVLDNYYLKYYMLGEKFQTDIFNEATGSTVLGIKGSRLKKIKVILPPLKEQKKIADILSTVDEQIENVDHLIEKTKELKKGLMQQLLTKGIGHTEFKETEVGIIPKDWKVKKLGECVEIRSGNSPSNFEFEEEAQYPFYKVDDMNYTNKFLEQAKVYFNSSRYELMPKGMIVFPKRGASIFTNKVAILSQNGYFDTNIMGLICNDKINNEYLFYQIKYIELQQFADTTAVPQINNKHINPLLVPLPSIKEQIKIVEVLSSIDNQINMQEKKKDKLLKLKNGLMQQLLTGKIRVKVD